MFERFTKPARAVVARAQEAANELSDEVTSAHLLLALTQDTASPAGAALTAADVTEERVRGALRARSPRRRLGPEDAAALSDLGIDLDAIRARVEEAFGAGALDAGTRTGRVRFSQEAKETLRNALHAALRLKHNYLGTEHLLLGILQQEGSGYELLRSFDVDLTTLRRQLEAGDAA